LRSNSSSHPKFVVEPAERGLHEAGESAAAVHRPTIVPGQTTLKAAHIQELRNAVSALP
jgi:hypothetical protein